MATTLFATPFSYFFFTLMVLLMLQFQSQARILQDKKNYVTVTTNTILNKATIHLPSTTPAPAPAQAPTISYISSTPDSSPAPAPAPADYGTASSPTPAPADYGSASSPAPSPADYGSASSPAPAPADYGSLYNYETTSPFSNLDSEEEEEEQFSADKETGNFNTFKETTDDEFSNTYSNPKTNSFTSDADEDVNNGLWTSNYRGYKSQPQGMSDTRLPGNANANLYNNYNLYNEDTQLQHDQENYNNYNLYNEDTQLQHDENYTPTSSGNQVEPQGYYHADRPQRQQKSRFEFDSMEEYEKQQGYPDVDARQDHFFP